MAKRDSSKVHSDKVNSDKDAAVSQGKDSEANEPLNCGLVMPISEIDGCSESHWADVQAILHDAVESAGFKPRLVSLGDDVGVIHKRIIQNLYEDPVVIVDVSAKNPNVMFELGIRLAFDKPTIVVKDDATSYSFDTSPIEHIGYPRDLRFYQIVEFKNELAAKIQATHREATADPSNFTTFLRHFGQYKVSSVEEIDVTTTDYILSELQDIKRSMDRQALYRRDRKTQSDWGGKGLDVQSVIGSISYRFSSQTDLDRALEYLRKLEILGEPFASFDRDSLHIFILRAVHTNIIRKFERWLKDEDIAYFLSHKNG